MNNAMRWAVGAGAGAAIALLFAPQTGDKTQRAVAKYTRKGLKQAGAAGKKVLRSGIRGGAIATKAAARGSWHGIEYAAKKAGVPRIWRWA